MLEPLERRRREASFSRPISPACGPEAARIPCGRSTDRVRRDLLQDRRAAPAIGIELDRRPGVGQRPLVDRVATAGRRGPACRWSRGRDSACFPSARTRDRKHRCGLLRPGRPSAVEREPGRPGAGRSGIGAARGCSSLKRVLPHRSSRSTSGVHRSATISQAFATGQN